MAISTSWRVEIGVYGNIVDFSSRTLGVSIDQQVDVNVVGRGTCTITLLNKDGALTPGGGGTYGTRDWFSNLVQITALTNTGGANSENAVFYGLVNNFDLTDDGVYSTVTITAVDALAVAGRTANFTIASGTSGYTAKLASLNISNSLPLVGSDVAAFGLVYEGPTVYVGSASSITATTIADAWQTNLVPSVNDVFWGTSITFQSYAGIVQCDYEAFSLGPYTTRDVGTRHTFEFDPQNSVSGSKLPFDDAGFVQAFNNDTLITSAQIQGTYAGATTTTVNAPTLTTYGARTVGYTQTMALDAAAVSELAYRLTNRYSTSRFSPEQLQVSASQIKRFAANAAHNKWRALLDVESGIWQQVKVTWQGSGASSQTAYCITKGRKIDITPSDTVVTLTLGNWQDNHSFILDEDVLDTGRLG